ncbi:MAG: isoleucine--tRNA ligase, partial [Candidatus Omnitrophica bacterium]|nr:isoleucine--tRNA ligase [Candidatus Omnitrophota bacterium]
VKFAIDDPEKFKSLISENGSIKKIIGRDVNVLIWTTTPWTLVSNVAIALSPEMRYALVEMRGELLVIAYDLLVTVSGKLGIARPEPLAVFPGRKLEGLLCRHPFIERLSGIVLADYVSREEGTGCVHTAPGHGQEDYITGRKYDLPTVMPVDSKGRFDETAGQFKGLHVFDANAEILRHLEKIGALMHSEDIEHSYPHCWRCKNPIIFRATWQYFMKVDHAGLRSKVSNEIKSNVRWIPEIGKDRIGAMVDNRPDWCLSRQRLWGVPIVAFYCKACGALLLDSDVINSVADIFETEGSDCWFSRVVSELIPNGTKCKKCGGSEFEKETDILDVWFESGVSHQAVLKSRREFPADLYLEGSDQHRGWFQSAIISSMAIENSAPYRSVLTHGFVVDGEGKKMSKSVGNVISPQDVMKKYGADILRIWVASCDYRDDIRISAEILSRLADAYRKIRNTARYILGNIHDYDVTKNKVPYEEISSIDKWALWRASNLLDSAESNFRNYSFHRVFYSLYNFCVVDMSSIYLDVLKDTLYIHGKDSVSRRGAQTVLYDILAIMTKIMAPILAYTAEEVWRAIPNNDNSESIHLKDWPDNAKLKSTLSNIFTTRDTGIWDDFLLPLRQGVLKVLENARGEGLIGSSLEAKVILYASEDPWIGLIKEHSDMLNKLFIVSSVAINDRKIEGAVAIDEVPVSIKVEKADGQKCLRCWNYSTSVRKENGHPSLCSRCAEVVKTMSK